MTNLIVRHVFQIALPVVAVSFLIVEVDAQRNHIPFRKNVTRSTAPIPRYKLTFRQAISERLKRESDINGSLSLIDIASNSL